MVCNNLLSTPFTLDFITNEVFNVCVIAVSWHRYEMLVVAFYRAPLVSIADSKILCNQLDLIVVNYSKVIIFGDFNIPNTRFDLPSCTETNYIHCFDNEHDLHLLKSAPTRGFSRLDLIFVSFYFANCEVSVLLFVVGADHSNQLFTIRSEICDINLRMRTFVNCQQLFRILVQVDCVILFQGCCHVNEYAELLTNQLRSAIGQSSTQCPCYKKARSPRLIFKLIHAKAAVW